MLGIKGGGKKLRMSALSIDEKILLCENALKCARVTIMPSGIPLLDQMIGEVDSIIDRMKDETDGSYLKRAISKLPIKAIEDVKEVLKRQMTERTLTSMGIIFFPEIKALQRVMATCEKLVNVIDMLFTIQLVRTYWGTNRAGELNVSELRMALETHIKKLEILMEAGVTMSD